MSTVLEFPAAPVAHRAASVLRIGLLGLGQVGSALVRLTHDAAPLLQTTRVVPAFTAALVRSTGRRRTVGHLVAHVTADVESFFAQPLDVVVEVLGGVEPAHALVRRALLQRLPVVTANKSLVAAYGESLSALARQQRTAFRYEASCIAGVPFLGTFERRPLARRVHGVTAILNGTSNSVVTRMQDGATFAAALAEAQRLGLAEPDPSMDVSGADAAEKLAILLRLFARAMVAPGALPTRAIDSLTAADLLAARAFGGAIKPIARATWTEDALDAFVGPALVSHEHPLAAVSGSTNGILLHAAGGPQFYAGPGAGPDVTAATLLDDIAELTDGDVVRSPPVLEARVRTAIGTPPGRWVLRAGGSTSESGIIDVLRTHGLSYSQLTTVAGNVHVLTGAAPADRVAVAAAALQATTSADILVLPIIEPLEDSRC